MLAFRSQAFVGLLSSDLRASYFHLQFLFKPRLQSRNLGVKPKFCLFRAPSSLELLRKESAKKVAKTMGDESKLYLRALHCSLSKRSLPGPWWWLESSFCLPIPLPASSVGRKVPQPRPILRSHLRRNVQVGRIKCQAVVSHCVCQPVESNCKDKSVLIKIVYEDESI